MSEMDQLKELTELTLASRQVAEAAMVKVDSVGPRLDRNESETKALRQTGSRLLVVLVTALIVLGLILSVQVYNTAQKARNNESLLRAQQVQIDRQIALNNDAQHRLLCPIVSASAPRPGDPPPVGDAEQRARAQRVRDAFTTLVREYKCVIPATTN